MNEKDFEELLNDPEKIKRYNDLLIGAAQDFYDAIGWVPYPMFLSIICMLVERKCADDNLNVMEIFMNMMLTAKEVNEDLGPTKWGIEINE